MNLATPDDAQPDLLSKIVAATPYPVFAFDVRGTLLYASRRARELSNGVDAPIDAPPTFQAMFRVFGPHGSEVTFEDLAGGRWGGGEATLHHADGAFTRVAVTCQRIEDSGAAVVMCFVDPLTRDTTHRQRILTQIYAEIISIKSLPEILETIVRLLVDIGEADHATITLLDKPRENFVVRHEYPPPERGPTLVGQLIPIRGYRIQERILRDKVAVIAPHVAAHEIFTESERVAELTRQLGTKSFAIFPLVYKDETIGTFSVDWLVSPRDFSTDDREMYQAIANQAAVAIENARLLERAQEFQQRYSEAYSAFSLEHVATRILDALRDTVEYHKASIQLIVDDRRILLSGRGFDKNQASPHLLGRVEHDAIVKAIVASQEITIIADTQSSPDWVARPETQDVKSWMGIPLVVDDRVIALITLDHQETGYYGTVTGEVRAELDQLARQNAVEISEAYRFDAAQHQIQGFDLLNRIAELVGTKLKPGDVLQGIAREIAERFDCEQCKILLREPGDTAPVLVARACWPQPAESEAIVVRVPATPTRPESPVAASARSGRSVIVYDFVDPSDAEQYARTPELPATAQSVVIAPIVVADRTLGAIVASHKKINAFSTSDALLMETLSRHTGIAIERNAALELVQSVGRSTLRAPDMKKVLEEIVIDAIKLTHTVSGVIYLFDDDATAVVDRFFTPGSNHPWPRMEREDSITRTVIREKKMIEIVDLSTDERVNPELRGQFKSMCAIPLLTQDEPADSLRIVGVLYVNGTTSRALTETERLFISTLADQAAIVIERTRLDQQVRRSEELYHSLVDHIPQAVFRKDPASRFVSANAAFCKTLGKQGRMLSEVTGHSDYAFYPSTLAAGFIRDDQHVMSTRLPLQKVELHQTKEMEEPIWVKVIKVPVIHDRKVVGVQAIFWDVTPEKNLEKLQERYRTLVEQSPDSIIVLEGGGTIMLENAATRRLFGVDKLKGRSIMDFVDPEDRRAAAAWLDGLTQPGSEDRSFEMRVRRRGETIEVAAYGRHLRDEGATQIVFHDLTQVNALITETHHRVHTALDVVSDLLSGQQRVTSHPAVRQAFDNVRNRIRAVALVHTMLQKQTGERRSPLRRYLTELTSAVHDCYVGDRGITFSVTADDLSLDATGTRDCGLIVTELVANSLRHGFGADGAGTIEVRLAEERGLYLLSVADSGRGLPAGDLEKRGSLGLRLVRILVADNLKGHFSIETRADGGTVASVLFRPPAQPHRS